MAQSMCISADQFIDRPVEFVFDRLCGHYFAYQPKWDPAILEIVPLEGPPTTIGSRAHIARTMKNRIEHGESLVVGLQPSSSITVEHRYPNNTEIRTVSCHPLQRGGTRLHVVIESELHGLAKIIAPLAQNMLERALAFSLHAAKLAVEDEGGEQP